MEKIAILTGGDSAEYNISLLSANTVLKHLNNTKYNGMIVHLKNGEYRVENQKINTSDFTYINGNTKIKFDKIGYLEAVVTSGGLSTMPWTFEGRLNTLQNKTLRYKGHWELMKAYRQLGLFREDFIDFKGIKFTPREFYHHLLEPQLNTHDKNDICIKIR